MIVPVDGVPAATPMAASMPAASAPAAAGGFGQWFSQEVGDLNSRLTHAEQGVRELATGNAASLHDVMIRLEEARLSFQVAVQFRARVLEAYQDVMRMQV